MVVGPAPDGLATTYALSVDTAIERRGFVLAIFDAVLLAGFDPGASAWPGVALAGPAAVMFGAYIVLSRRWSVRYSLDGTLVTIANLISGGPFLLLIEAIRAVPQQIDPVATAALLTIAFGSSSTANLFLIGSVRRLHAANVGDAAAHPDCLGLDQHRPARPPNVSHRLTGATLVLVGMAGATGLLGRRGRPSSDAS